MALRFFADHCVSNFIIESLAADGHEVLRLKDHLRAESPVAREEVGLPPRAGGRHRTQPHAPARQPGVRARP